jgi:hypothetical protein
VINEGAAGAVALSVSDLATLLPQPETAITDSTKVVGVVGNFTVMLLESTAFTLISWDPVDNVHL